MACALEGCDPANVIEDTEKEHECEWFEPISPMTPQETDELQKDIEQQSVIEQKADQEAEQEVLDILLRAKTYKKKAKE